MKILIVDDERLARERLQDLLLDIGEETDLLQAENGLACLKIAEQTAIDIILLDIRMPGMDGLETAYHLATLEPPPAIIFTTAYQDHAIDAFNAHAVDYLLKPIRRVRLLEALQRAQFINRAHVNELRRNVGGGQARRSYLGARSQGTIELVPVAEIRYLKADQKYVSVGWPGHEILIDEALKSIEAEFGDRFLRVHRNALVALAHIEALEKDSQGRNRLRLRGVEARPEVSRRHLHSVRQAIKRLGL